MSSSVFSTIFIVMRSPSKAHYIILSDPAHNSPAAQREDGRDDLKDELEYENIVTRNGIVDIPTIEPYGQKEVILHTTRLRYHNPVI